MEMYSTRNKENSAIIERFITTIKKLKNTWLQFKNNVFIDELDDIGNKCKNTHHSTINIKPVDVKLNTYLESSKETNAENLKSKIGDTARTSKYKNSFAKGYIPYCSV